MHHHTVTAGDIRQVSFFSPAVAGLPPHPLGFCPSLVHSLLTVSISLQNSSHIAMVFETFVNITPPARTGASRPHIRNSSVVYYNDKLPSGLQSPSVVTIVRQCFPGVSLVSVRIAAGMHQLTNWRLQKRALKASTAGSSWSQVMECLGRVCCVWNRSNTSCFTKVCGHCHNSSSHQGIFVNCHPLTYYLVIGPLAPVGACFCGALFPTCVPLQKNTAISVETVAHVMPPARTGGNVHPRTEQGLQSCNRSVPEKCVCGAWSSVWLCWCW